jgi:hypothetical protein
VQARSRLGDPPTTADLDHRGLTQVDDRRALPVTAADFVLAGHQVLPAAAVMLAGAASASRTLGASQDGRGSPAMVQGPAAQH